MNKIYVHILIALSMVSANVSQATCMDEIQDKNLGSAHKSFVAGVGLGVINFAAGVAGLGVGFGYYLYRRRELHKIWYILKESHQCNDQAMQNGYEHFTGCTGSHINAFYNQLIARRRLPENIDPALSYYDQLLGKKLDELPENAINELFVVQELITADNNGSLNFDGKSCEKKIPTLNGLQKFVVKLIKIKKPAPIDSPKVEE